MVSIQVTQACNLAAKHALQLGVGIGQIDALQALYNF